MRLKKYDFSKSGVYIAFIALLGFNVIYTKNFAHINTLWNLIVYSTTTIIVALGMNLVIATGGIDISVGSTMAITAILVAVLMGKIGLFPSIVIALIISAFIGYIIGSIIENFNIQPIVATLSMMITLRGIAQIISKGAIITFKSKILESISYYRINGIVPIQVIFIIAFVTIFYIYVNKTIWGRYNEAVGEGKEAAHIMGIDTKKTIKTAYIILGIMAGIAGILESSRLSAVNPNTLGQLIELDAIASVAIGGTLMGGGKAKIVNTVVGVFIMTLITMTINMNDIQYSYSLILKTIIIIVAVYIQKNNK